MRARLIDGKATAARLRAEYAVRARRLRERLGMPPGLAVILVGEDPASRVYVRNKIAACREAGVRSELVELPGDVAEPEVLGHVERLNADPAVHGILVQLPLPPQIRVARILERIDPRKDVDGFHPQNVGALASGASGLQPCTPLGVVKLLEHEGVPIDGAHAVVVGRSNIVGKPVALMLLQRGATVTICHSRTRELAEETRRGDILVVAVGRPRLIGPDMVKPGAVVIDVGINRLPDGRLVGDVDSEGVGAVAARLTPVPGGVGPMTIAMLLHNTLVAAELSRGGSVPGG